MPRSRGKFPARTSIRSRCWGERSLSCFNVQVTRLVAIAYLLARLLQLRIWNVILTYFPKLALWLMVRPTASRESQSWLSDR